MSAPIGAEFFFFFGKEHRGISNRGGCKTVLKFHRFRLPFEKQIINFRLPTYRGRLLPRRAAFSASTHAGRCRHVVNLRPAALPAAAAPARAAPGPGEPGGSPRHPRSRRQRSGERGPPAAEPQAGSAAPRCQTGLGGDLFWGMR